MTPYISSPATFSKTPPAARPHRRSTYPPPASPQTSPDFSPAPASPLEDNPAPAPPADSPHTATQIVVPPDIAAHCARAERATPAYAPPATRLPPPLLSPAPEAPLAPPISSPASRSPTPANVADCF